ncbi:MAG: chain-length determining protein [Muribaculaceae bacterium]|nr:chain-length determining protein [Muribaculaceae bacterium]
MSDKEYNIEEEEKEIDLLELFKKVWAKRKMVMIWCAVGAVLGLVIAFSIPKEYTTSIKLAPEAGDSKSSSGGMGALAAMAGINLGSQSADAVSVQLYPDIVKSVPFSLSLLSVPVTDVDEKKHFTIQEYLDKDVKSPWWSVVTSIPGQILSVLSTEKPEEPDPNHKTDAFKLTKDEEKLVNAVNNAVNVAVDAKTFVITINVTAQDPMVSAILADSVASKLKEYVTRYRTNKARQDLEYVRNLNSEAKEAYYTAQQKYAKFLDENQGIVLYSAQTMRDRLENEATLAFNMFNQTSQQLQMAEAKVQQETPVFATIEPATVPIKPSAPRKVLILAGFIFLAGVMSVAWILFVQPLREEMKKGKKQEEEEDTDEMVLHDAPAEDEKED